MNTHKLFQKFHDKIEISDSKAKKLKSNRTALREKIKQYFKDEDWKIPRFYSQGSFPLKTIVNPIKKEDANGHAKEKYDLDDGVYFICPESDRKEVDTYHKQVKEAVDGHTDEVKDKNTCVRVIYADGHHIDLPIYWMETEDSTPQLAHKSEGYITSDPKAFSDWVKNKMSAGTQSGQLKRIIQYLKAWADYLQDCDSQLCFPSGMILTVLACNHYSENERDDMAIKDTVQAIQLQLSQSFVCYHPTQTGEDLLDREKYDRDTVLSKFDTFVRNATEACSSTCECEKEASEYWRELFGDRFPLGEKNNGGKLNKVAPTVVVPTVAARKPYGGHSDNSEQIKLKCDRENLENIQENFPNLYYVSADNCIEGEMSVNAVYRLGRQEWEIVSCSENSGADCVTSCYRIKIDLNSETPKVYETSGKILEVGKKLNRTAIQMHLYPDGNCCLEFNVGSNPDLRLSQFVINLVYPYFVWQAYYEKHERIPPCGEYPHTFSEARLEYQKDIENWVRNRRCYCGSGEKFKKCCMNRRLKISNKKIK